MNLWGHHFYHMPVLPKYQPILRISVIPSDKLPGQKSFLVGILGEIHSEFNWLLKLSAEVSLKGLKKVSPNWVNKRLCKHCFKNEWTLVVGSWFFKFEVLALVWYLPNRCLFFRFCLRPTHILKHSDSRRLPVAHTTGVSFLGEPGVPW